MYEYYLQQVLIIGTPEHERDFEAPTMGVTGTCRASRVGFPTSANPVTELSSSSSSVSGGPVVSTAVAADASGGRSLFSPSPDVSSSSDRCEEAITSRHSPRSGDGGTPPWSSSTPIRSAASRSVSTKARNRVKRGFDSTTEVCCFLEELRALAERVQPQQQRQQRRRQPKRQQDPTHLRSGDNRRGRRERA